VIAHPDTGVPTRISGAEPGDKVVRIGVWAIVYAIEHIVEDGSEKDVFVFRPL
jgi:hypothetical protein